MATTQEIIDQAIRRLSELSTSSPVHWTRAEMLEYLTEAVNELNLIAAEYQTTQTVNSAVNVNVYSLSSDTVAPLAVRVDGKYLLKESVDNLDNEAQWEADSETRLRPKIWSALGSVKILIWPRFITNPSVIHVETLTQHPTITDGVMTLSISEEYETALEDYMVHRAMFREGGPELSQVEAFYARFLDAAQDLSKRNIIRRYPAWQVAPETKLMEEEQ